MRNRPDGSVLGGRGFEDRAVGGTSNPTSIELEVRYDGDDVVADVVLRRGSKARPVVDGGIVAAAFDDVTGFVIGQLQEPAFTGELTVRYLAPVPVEETLEIRARLDGRERRKLFISAEMHAGEVLVATCRADLHHRRSVPLRRSPRPPLTDRPGVLARGRADHRRHPRHRRRPDAAVLLRARRWRGAGGDRHPRGGRCDRLHRGRHPALRGRRYHAVAPRSSTGQAAARPPTATSRKWPSSSRVSPMRASSWTSARRSLTCTSRGSPTSRSASSGSAGVAG